MFILCCRIIMSMAFTWLFLACTGRLRELFAAFRDRRVMKYLVPAALFLCFDWALFNWPSRTATSWTRPSATI